MLVVGYAFRYEPDWMIDDLHENMKWVDKFVSFDTRDARETWVPAEVRTATLYRKAVRMGRRYSGRVWFLQMAPDERLEDSAKETLRAVIEGDPQVRYTLRLRELWTPTEYRVDGIWGGKRRRRLYQLNAGGPIGNQTVNLDTNLYHLKMVEEANRQRRRDVFTDHNTWDNKTRGFDYLTDETGLKLEAIPEGKQFTPGYRVYDFQVPGYE